MMQKSALSGLPEAFYIKYLLSKSANSYVKGLPKIRPENVPTSYVKRDREIKEKMLLWPGACLYRIFSMERFYVGVVPDTL